MNGLSLEDPAYFARLAEVESRHWWSIGLARIADAWLDRALKGRRDLVALDAGCGAGLNAARLARRGEIASVLALDPSPFAVRLAGSRSGVGILQASLLDLPFPKEQFDVLTCFDVLQHLPPNGDRLACDEIARVLRPGGVALIRSNGVGGWKAGSGRDEPYRLDRLRDLLSAAGLQIRRATYVNCLPSLAQELRAGLAGKGKRSGGHPAGKGLRIETPRPWVNRLMTQVATAESIAAGRWGWKLPFGHSTMLLAEKPATIEEEAGR